jgi:hypothetical protein
MNNVAVKFVYKFLSSYISLGYIPRSRLAEKHSNYA